METPERSSVKVPRNGREQLNLGPQILGFRANSDPTERNPPGVSTLGLRTDEGDPREPPSEENLGLPLCSCPYTLRPNHGTQERILRPLWINKHQKNTPLISFQRKFFSKITLSDFRICRQFLGRALFQDLPLVQ